MERLAARGWVGTPADARACDVSEATWHRRTNQRGWARPYASVRVAPWAPPGPMTGLRALLAACRGRGVAAGLTALWLHGAHDAPEVIEVVVPHGSRIPKHDRGAVTVRRVAWLEDDDVDEVDGVAVLAWAAVPLSLAWRRPGQVRALLIDAVQAGGLDLDEVAARLDRVGPMARRGRLGEVLGELGARQPESWFHDVVLTEMQRRGYPVLAAPLAVDTPDGRGLRIDIPLPTFRVGVEPEGDRYHRGRGQRRNDRRRQGQAAGTDWRLVPVDWRDWHQRRSWVFSTIDAALLAQVGHGVGTVAELPEHLRGEVHRRSA